MFIGGGGGGFSVVRWRSVWLNFLNFIHLKAKSEKHIHNNDVLFL